MDVGWAGTASVAELATRRPVELLVDTLAGHTVVDRAVARTAAVVSVVELRAALEVLGAAQCTASPVSVDRG